MSSQQKDTNSSPPQKENILMPLTDYAVSGDKNKKIGIASPMTAPR